MDYYEYQVYRMNEQLLENLDQLANHEILTDTTKDSKLTSLLNTVVLGGRSASFKDGSSSRLSSHSSGSKTNKTFTDSSGFLDSSQEIDESTEKDKELDNNED